MALRFTDANGWEGEITDSLTVDYTGTWEEEVEEYVARLEREVCSKDRAFQELNVMNHLVLELPEVAPIIEVERDIA